MRFVLSTSTNARLSFANSYPRAISTYNKKRSVMIPVSTINLTIIINMHWLIDINIKWKRNSIEHTIIRCIKYFTKNKSIIQSVQEFTKCSRVQNVVQSSNSCPYLLLTRCVLLWQLVSLATKRLYLCTFCMYFHNVLLANITGAYFLRVTPYTKETLWMILSCAGWNVTYLMVLFTGKNGI